MSFIKSFVSKHIHAAAASRPTGMEAIAVFFYGNTPAPESITTVAREAHGAAADISNEDDKTRVKLVWPDVHTVITIDPTWNKVAQMHGMRGWTERFPAKVRELTEVRALIDSFDDVDDLTADAAIVEPDADEARRYDAERERAMRLQDLLYPGTSSWDQLL